MLFRSRFIENNCVQCGLCETTCPEKAIRLVPRLLVTPAARQAVTLNEAEPFHCVRCGAPFGTRQMIDVMTGAAVMYCTRLAPATWRAPHSPRTGSRTARPKSVFAQLTSPFRDYS